MKLHSLTPRDVVTLIGMILEIVGAIAMANSYLSAARRRQWFGILLSALIRGRYARGAIAVREINGEDGLLALQGLGLIALGFIAETIAMLLL